MSTLASERAICSASLTTRSIAASFQTKLRLSAATASITAAMSSGSGGSGMYSLAPAWMAATAARASVPVPQAITGVRMRSASSAVTRSRTERPTSIMMRSAPLARSTDRPCSMASAWVTPAPRLMAILEAATSSPLSRPMMRRRMDRFLRKSRSVIALDDFGHGDAEALVHEDHLAAGNKTVVDQDVDRLADPAVEFQDGARRQLEEVADRHARVA